MKDNWQAYIRLRSQYDAKQHFILKHITEMNSVVCPVQADYRRWQGTVKTRSKIMDNGRNGPIPEQKLTSINVRLDILAE
ncbi:MAG: hypothetical protein AB8B87_24355 [Granulosicoccus sp.]